MTGYIKIYRKIIHSDIYRLPPLYLRVFERLIMEANHTEKSIPYKDRLTGTFSTKIIRRGEKLTSIKFISDWVAWYERGILKTPNKKTIKKILDWLVQNKMIEIRGTGDKSNRKETHYYIVNYNSYQSVNNMKVTAKVTKKKRSVSTNNNDKENIINQKKKSILYCLAKLYQEIFDTIQYSKINHLINIKKNEPSQYYQKVLMLMYILKNNISLKSYANVYGKIYNEYRNLTYEDFKTQVFNNKKFIINEFEKIKQNAKY